MGEIFSPLDGIHDFSDALNRVRELSDELDKSEKYLLFCFDDYYPGGGWNDYQGIFDNIDEATNHANVDGHWSRDYWQVVSTKTFKVIASNG